MGFFVAAVAIVVIIEAVLWQLFRLRLRALAPLEQCCNTPLERFIRAKRMTLVMILHTLLLLAMISLLFSAW